jgi:hypothetical protein
MRWVVALVVLVLLVAACGGSSGADPELVSDFADFVQGGDVGLIPRDDAECYAERLIDEWGEERAEAFYVETPTAFGGPDSTEAEIEVITDAVSQCIDMREVMAFSMVSEAGWSEQDAECFVQEFPEEDMAAFLVFGSVMFGEDGSEPDEEDLDPATLALFARFFEAQATCGVEF